MNDGIIRLEDEAYGPHERQRYDLSLPGNCEGSRGLILFIHGGAWIGGDKGCYAEEREIWAGRGVPAASVNYHYLSPEAHMDTLIADIALALEAIRDKAAQYGADLDRVLLTGASAGGHLSLLYAYTMGKTSPIRPVCVVDYCGPTLLTDEALLYGTPANYPPEDKWITLFSDLTGIPYRPENMERILGELRRYSPVTHVSDDSVPTVLCYGQRDDVVPFSNAEALFRALLEHHVETVFLPMPDAGHSLENPEIREESQLLFRSWVKRFL